MDKVITLLEEIVFRLSPGAVEKEEFIRRLYARSEQSAAAVHGDVRTQSTARKRQVSEQGCSSGILEHIDKEPARTQILKK